MNNPSTMKSVSCQVCGFSTGSLKPNREVDLLLSRMIDKPVSPSIGLLWDDHSYTALPFDPAKALEVVLRQQSTKATAATLVSFGLEGVAPVGINGRHLSNVETVAKEWLQAVMKAFNKVIS
jgi:hypothetical protein